jgi:FkbM family methyltransferase
LSLKERFRYMLPSAVRPRKILAGPLRGDYIVTSWHDYPAALLGYAESGLLNWFAENVRPGETWLDLGAHYGYTSLALCRHVGPAGRVFAFEPLLNTAGHLSSTRQANKLSQLTVVPLALGDFAEITTVDAQICKAMAQPLAAPVKDAWVEPILCVGLDNLWGRLCNDEETISGIKMDVEGMEGKALQGMIGLLKKHQPKLIIEVHKSRGVDLQVLAPVLREAGYSAAGCLIGKTASPDADASYEFLVDHACERAFASPIRAETSVASYVGK